MSGDCSQGMVQLRSFLFSTINIISSECRRSHQFIPHSVVEWNQRETVLIIQSKLKKINNTEICWHYGGSFIMDVKVALTEQQGCCSEPIVLRNRYLQKKQRNMKILSTRPCAEFTYERYDEQFDGGICFIVLYSPPTNTWCPKTLHLDLKWSFPSTSFRSDAGQKCIEVTDP